MFICSISLMNTVVVGVFIFCFSDLWPVAINIAYKYNAWSNCIVLWDSVHPWLPFLQLKEFDNFFSPGGRAVLIFFYQPPKEEQSGEGGGGKTNTAYNANGRRLWITDGTEDAYTGTCLFFLRINIQKAITMLNIHLVCFSNTVLWASDFNICS